MPKNIVIILVLILIIGGGVFLYSQKQKLPMQQGQQGNVFTSIKDALSKSVSLECNYTDDQGRASKTFIKNGAIRSDFTGKTESESGSVIVSGKKMYMWTANKEGFTFEVPENAEAPTGTQAAPAGGNNGVSQKEDLMSNLEKYKQDCKPAVVSDSLFTPPADVKFTDYSQMMKQVPSAGAGGGVDQQQIQQYMQKYQNQSGQ